MRAVLAAAVLLLAVNADAAERRPVKVEDFSRFQDVADPQLSPDGEWVLYTLTSTDAAKDRRDSDVWLVKWDGSQRSRLTYSAENESSPRWSPDGRYISFLSSRPGDAKGTQVWVLDRTGGEARQLTHLKGRIASYDWSPDAKQLALVYREPEPDAQEPGREGGGEAAAAKPIVIDKYQFKRDGPTYLTGNVRSRIYLYDIASEKAERLTGDGDYDESGPEWSPDGRRIAFVSNHDANWERTRNTDVFVVDATIGAKSRQLTTWPGADGGGFGGGLAWSPDGALIAYGQGSEPKYDFHDLSRLAVVPAAGGAPRVLTTSLDRGTSAPAFTQDGKAIEFLVADDRTQYLARVPVTGGPVERVVAGRQVVSAPSRVKGRTALIVSTDTEPAEVYALDASGSRPAQAARASSTGSTGATSAAAAPRKLTTHNDSLAAGLDLTTAEDIAFKSKDGAEIHALLTKPLGYKAGTRVPTLVRIHGGPTGQDTHAFNFERQLFAADGYAVLNVNYRGSSGRGAKFSEAIFADWGHLEVDDVLAAVDYAVAQGIADPERLGIGGWSYGGVLTDYVIASDTRFKAAISGAGSANHISLYGHDQYTFLYDNEFGPPWKNVDLWLKFSYPFFKADRIRTPTLFMGGQNDFNVPILGSEQMYQALTTLNVPTQLVVYPGQNHGLTKVSFIRDRYERYLAWYGKYLKSAGPAPGPAGTQGSKIQ
jgi:dipeptidyl aminopeptidase/acylaminoacyl peptidase